MKQKLKYLLLLLFVNSGLYAQKMTIDNPPDVNIPAPPVSETVTPENKNSSDINLPDLQSRIGILQNQLSDLNVYLSSLQVRLNDIINGSDNTDMPMDEKQTKVQTLQQELMTTDTKLKEAKTELDRLGKEISSLESQPAQSGKIVANEILNNDIKNLEDRVAQLESKVKILIGAKENTSTTLPDDMQSTKKDIEESLAPDIKNGDMTVENDTQAIKVKLNGNILFREAEISISPEGEKSLQKIAPLLKNLKNKLVMIIGHADPKPIGKNFKDFYPTNWELSTTRGAMVVRYLTEVLGVDPSILLAAGRSFYQPSPDGVDRRTEIWIFPKLSVDRQSLDS